MLQICAVLTSSFISLVEKCKFFPQYFGDSVDKVTVVIDYVIKENHT